MEIHSPQITTSGRFITFEELATLFTRIEAIMNSRLITPGHFLIGDALLSLPKMDYIETSTNRLQLYQVLQKISQHFWLRWSREYPTRLQQRTKWKENDISRLSVDNLVILKEDNTPSQQWRMGPVIELHLGADSIARVASIKTNAGVFQRSVHKRYKLPVDSQSTVENSGFSRGRLWFYSSSGPLKPPAGSDVTGYKLEKRDDSEQLRKTFIRMMFTFL